MKKVKKKVSFKNSLLLSIITLLFFQNTYSIQNALSALASFSSSLVGNQQQQLELLDRAIKNFEADRERFEKRITCNDTGYSDETSTYPAGDFLVRCTHVSIVTQNPLKQSYEHTYSIEHRPTKKTVTQQEAVSLIDQKYALRSYITSFFTRNS